jgi:hypothetical protein
MYISVLGSVTKRHIAALATWSVIKATAMMAANPAENFTNSIKKGRVRRFLFF